MTVWIKQGVMGNFHPIVQKGIGRLSKLYAKNNLDFFITSCQEGTHLAGSLHYCGMAVDFRGDRVSVKAIRQVLGKHWDVIDEGHHVHAEYDPKNVPIGRV